MWNFNSLRYLPYLEGGAEVSKQCKYDKECFLDYIEATQGDLTFEPTPIAWSDGTKMSYYWSYVAGGLRSIGKTAASAVKYHKDCK